MSAQRRARDGSPEQGEVRVEGEGAAEPRARADAVPEAAVDHPAVEELRRVARAEAQRWSRQALRLGTRDALKLFHRGMIERCLGHRVAADRYLHRALALNPHFSIVWSPVAREALG